MTHERIRDQIFEFYRSNASLYTRQNKMARTIGRGVNFFGAVFPSLAEIIAWRLFITPRRFPILPEEVKLKESARVEEKRLDGNKTVVFYQWGDGPQVFIAHGWESRATRHGELINSLVSAGYSVASFDAPGHGHSTGKSSDLREFAFCLGLMAKQNGTAEAVIGHSFGGLAAIYAIKNEQVAKRVINVASPALFDGLVESFARTLNLNDSVRQTVIERCEEYFDDLSHDVWERLSAFYEAEKFHTPTMLIHDEEDRDVASIESALLAERLPDAKLILTTGLGHNKVIRDEKIIDKIIAFIKAGS